MNTRLFLALALVTRSSGRVWVTHTASRAIRLLQLVCIGLVCLCCETYAQGVAEPLFTLRQVGPNVWAAMSNRAANTEFVIGDDGVLVIDTAASVDGDGNFSLEHGTQLLAAIRKLTNLPVKYVINSADECVAVQRNRIVAERRKADDAIERTAHYSLHT